MLDVTQHNLTVTAVSFLPEPTGCTCPECHADTFQQGAPVAGIAPVACGRCRWTGGMNVVSSS